MSGGREKLLGLILILATGVPALGTLMVTESFNINTDTAGSGWEYANNRTSPQNFGWSNSNNTGSAVNPPFGTATGAGEMGGTISRAATPASFYGYNVGSITLDQDFEARGVIRYVGGSGGFNLGFFRGASSFGSGGNAVNFVGFFFDDAKNSYATIFDASGARNRSDSPYDLISGTTQAFRMEYRTNGFNPDTLVLTLDGNSHTLLAGITAPSLLPLTHFGILPTSAAGSAATLYRDDLTFTTNPVPEPGAMGLLALSGFLSLRRRRRGANQRAKF
jgi:hypothetical protein